MTLLTESRIAEIAALYDFDPRDPLVVESVEQANAYAQQQGDDPVELLDCYLAETARVMQADADAHCDFRRNAY